MKAILISTLFLILGLNTWAQDDVFPPDNNTKTEEKSWLNPNIFWGGNFGAAFGTITSVDVSPLIGYRFFNERLNVGVGLSYQYYADKRINFSTSIYGGRVFAQILPPGLDMFLTHAELEAINYAYFMETRTTVINPLVGGGIRLPGGTRQFMSIMLLWNLNGDSNISSNPLMRIGYTF